MKILLITPFYDTDGRPDLQHDTSAIHYFVKYWTDKHEVKVLNVYPHSYKDILRYRFQKNRKYYQNGYTFLKDRAEVCITEVQKLPGQKGNYFGLQKRHIISQFKKWMDTSSFIPEVILVHVPSYAYTYIQDIKNYFGKSIPVFGILHKTDIEELSRNKALKNILESRFGALYARSHGILRRAEAYGLHNLKNDIIHSGIPLNAVEDTRSPNRLDETLQIVYAGKLVRLKHVDAVIHALSRLNTVKFRFDIIGSGPEEQYLRKLTKELGLEKKVFFLGRMDRNSVMIHMQKANLYCMPSFPETLGLTYLEAMSVGCIPIGTKGEGIDGIIQDGWNGYLVDATNLIDSVMEKIKTYAMLNDEAKKLLSERAKESTKELDEEICAKKYLEIVQKQIITSSL